MATYDEVAAAVARLDKTASAIMRERDLLRAAVRGMEQILGALREQLEGLAKEVERG